MESRISVIVSIYNVQEYLEECIDSILSQTISDWKTEGFDRNLQIILVDYGSTDYSGTIAQNYAENYDNVEYVFEEYQGLGHSRNHGYELSDGKYMVFVDGCDIIPPKSLERMYNAAINNNHSDLVAGTVLSFNLKNTFSSYAHELAYCQMKELTNIKESPELIYDTTIGNKLIRRSFWRENNFKFSEEINGDDTSLSTLMYSSAGNVPIIYDYCYLMRFRRDLFDSITKNTELENLKESIHVKESLDEFINEYDVSGNLRKINEIKWLKIDFMQFIDKLTPINLEKLKDTLDLLSDFIKDNFDSNIFNDLNEIENLKIEYLLDKDYASLSKLVKYENQKFFDLNVHSRDSHIVLEGDEDLFKSKSFNIDNYIKEGYLYKLIHKVSHKKKNIEIEGILFIPGLNQKDFKDRKLSFYLVNFNNQKRIPLKHSNINVDLSSEKFPLGDHFNYDASGYKIKIPYSEIRDKEELYSENKILVHFEQAGVVRNLFLGKAPKSLRDNSDLWAQMRGDNYFSFKYDANNELIIDISPVRHRYVGIHIDGDKLCINSPYNGDMVLSYKNSLLSEEEVIPVSYDEANEKYCIAIDKIRSEKGRFEYVDGEIPVHKYKKYFIFYTDYGQLVVSTLWDYYYDIEKVDNLTRVVEYSNQNDNVRLKTELHAVDGKGKRPKVVSLYYLIHKSQEKIYFAEGEILNDEEVIFNFDLSDKVFIDNLYSSFFDIFVKYDFDDMSFITPLYLTKEFTHTYETDSYEYSIYRSKKRRLRFKASKKEDKYEDKEDFKLILYKLFRLLPINKKRVFFESLWGRKYSCNPRYFYEYIDENHPEYECIWSLNDENWPIVGNGKRVRRNSLKYFYYLATSKYFVDNVNIDDLFKKRKNQVYLQTMHGTPLKTLGLDVEEDFKDEENKQKFIARCKRWDYMPVQNDFVSDLSKRIFLYDNESLKVGYPRTDILYTKNNEKDINEIKERLGLPLDKKVILYAPTWRDKSKFEIMLDLKSFKESLYDDYVLVLRLHHFSYNEKLNDVDNEFIFNFSHHDSIEELYLVSDILITDYSSVMFDYSLLNRPILLFAYDLKNYKNNLRGMYFDIVDNRPGPILFTSKEVEDSILNIDKVEDETKELRENFKEKFLHYECEDSSQKIFNRMFE